MAELTSIYDELLEIAKEFETPNGVEEIKRDLFVRQSLSNLGAHLVKEFCHTRRDEIEYIRDRIIGVDKRFRV